MSKDEIKNEAFNAFNGCICRYGITTSPQEAAELVDDIADSIRTIEGKLDV